MTATRPLPGGGALPAPSPAFSVLPEDVREHLLATYGGPAGDVLAPCVAAAALAMRVDPEPPYLWAEVVHESSREHAREVADVLARRVPLFRQARDQASASRRSSPRRSASSSGGRPRAVNSPSTPTATVAASRAWRNDAI